jgi:pyruvate kinase
MVDTRQAMSALSHPVRAIVTVPPYAPFLAEVAAHPIVSALGPPLWVDLKGRQLRVTQAAVPPFTEVRLSHRIRLHTPADAFFSDGKEHAQVVAVDGDRLILLDGPRRFIGPGESVNIVDPSLQIEGSLTDTDRAYLHAMRERGLRNVMLSFVEGHSDLAEVRELLPGAQIVCKIESKKGLDWVRDGFAVAQAAAEPGPSPRLMAARGDLYVEVYYPHNILGALRRVIAADRHAIAASRIFSSLARGPDAIPDCADLSDAAYLITQGYRTLMLGDEVCLRRDSVLAALNLLDAVASELRPYAP